ncbi:MAG: type II secretion system F family protein [Anaerovoracaceae bacterium]
MPDYKYKAAQLNGKYVKGVKSASSQGELRSKLEEEKLFLVEVKEEEPLKQKAFNDKRLIEFCRDLGMLLGTGVPLIKALNVMVQRDIDKRIKDVYVRLYQDLQAGNMLSEAMAMSNGVFPLLLINMLKASEASGGMEETLLAMAKYYEKNYKLKQKIKGAMIYPIILAIVTVLVVLGVFTLVLPKFFEMFKDLDTPLPAITQVMLGISQFVSENWLILIIGMLLIIVGIKSLKTVPRIKLYLDKTKLKLPVVGKLVKIIYTARFARTLSSCYTSGISMINSLQNTQKTIGNLYIESQFDDMIAMVRNGENLSTAINSIEGFDKRLVSNIVIGEETGKLDSMLTNVAEVFDFDAEVALGKLTAMVEPAMIILMAIIIGTIMISVLLPLPTMYNSVSGMGGM